MRRDRTRHVRRVRTLSPFNVFGIVHKSRLYFKVTPRTVERYKTQGMKPFRPNARQTLKSFYEVPVDIVEDTEQLTAWAQEAGKK